MLIANPSASRQVVQQNEIPTTNTMAEKYDDTELIRLLRGDKAMQDRALVFMMSKMRTNIIKHLRSKGCFEDRAESFFLEGLTKGVQSICKGDFRMEGSLEGYFKTICLRMWLTALKSENARKAREEVIGHRRMSTTDLTADDLIFQEQRAFLLKEFLQKLGKGCADIMLLKADGYSSKEIVRKTDYSTPGSVDKRNSVCMEKLRRLMEKSPHIMKLLKELHEK